MTMGINWGQLKHKFNKIMESTKYVPGHYYRALTFDGDIYDGRLTLVTDSTIELQIGDSFKSFNRGTTEFVKLPSLDCT